MIPKVRFISFPLLTIALCLFPAATGQAGDRITLDGQADQGPCLQVERSDFDSVDLAFSLNGLDSSVVETQGGLFTLLSVDDYGYTREVGHPRLPVARELIEIPHGGEYELIVSGAVWAEYSLASLGVGNRIVPAQPPLAKSQAGTTAFVINGAAYSADAWSLGRTAVLGEESRMRHHRLVLLEVFPVDYNPAAGLIRVLKSATISVAIRDADVVTTRTMFERYASPRFDKLARSVVLNAAAFETAARPRSARTSRATGYLMIAAPSFVGNNALQSLVNVRTSEGFDVTLVDTNTTGTGTTNIKNYIQTAYNTWNPAPEYILLIGDTNTIARWTGSGSYSPATDLNYACLSGSDYFPDVFRGRLSVRDSTDLTNLCTKIEDMVTNDVKEAVFMASQDNWNISEGTHNYVISNYLDPDGWTSDKLYCRTYNATTSQVTNAFNDGRTIGCFSGHGSQTSWADGPSFSQSNVRALTNTIYPFVYSFSCLTGSYHITECFGETWIIDNHGATAFIGASVSSYWDEDDILEKRMFRGWFDYSHDQAGPMIDYGQYELYLWMGSGSFSRMYYEMFNLLGEPAMGLLGSGGSSGDVVPDIKVNDDDGPLSVPVGTQLDITVSLDPGDQVGVAKDWWIFVEWNWNNTWYWRPPSNWTMSATPIRSYSGALYSISNYPVGSGTVPSGFWDFYFCIDDLNNVYEGTWQDVVEVQVSGT